MGVSALSGRMRTEDSTFPVAEPKTALARSPRLARTAKRLTVGSPAQRLSMPLLDHPRRGSLVRRQRPSRRNRTDVTNAALHTHTGSFSFALNSISGARDSRTLDAAHVAIAVTNGADYLVTWDFRHIANTAMRTRIELVCRQAGYEPPVICTPNELV